MSYNNGLFAFLIDSGRQMSQQPLASMSSTAVQVEEGDKSRTSDFDFKYKEGGFFGGFSCMDVAKAFVESFYQKISRNCSENSHMSHPSLYLSTSCDNRSCELVSIGEHFASFEHALKMLHVTNANSASEDFYSNCDGALHESFSYSLSHLFNLVNKYRAHTGVDNFGLGIAPRSVQPANIFIVTNLEGIRNNRTFEMSKRSHYFSLNDLRSEIWSWDQHVHLIIVGAESLDSSDEDNNLLRVCRESGGEVYLVKEAKHASLVGIAVASKMLNNSPTATVGINLSTKKSSSSHLSSLASLPVARNILSHVVISDFTTRVWHIPENYWIDMNAESELRPRNPYPTLLLTRISSSFAPSIDKWLQLCQIYEIPIDIYDMITNPFKIDKVDRNKATANSISNGVLLSHLKSCGYSKSDSFYVSIEGSNNPSLLHNNHEVIPFAICKFNVLSGNFQLMILPFNFPKLLNLIKNIHEGLENSNSQYNNNQAQQEFKSYMSTVPHYYYPALMRIIEKNRVLQSSFGTSMKGLSLIQTSKHNMRKFQKAQDVASQDIQQINDIVRVKRQAGHDKFGVQDVMGSTLKYERDFASATRPPTSLTSLKAENLLMHWETFRRACYGGGSGVVVTGLHVKGIESESHHFASRTGIESSRATMADGNLSCSKRFGLSNNDSSSNSSDVTHLKRKGSDSSGIDPGHLLGCDLGSGLNWSVVGGNPFVQESLRSMSDFVPVLSRKQVLRDALLMDAPVDEDEPIGILKRKLEVDLNPAGHKFGSAKHRGDKPGQQVAVSPSSSSVLIESVVDLGLGLAGDSLYVDENTGMNSDLTRNRKSKSNSDIGVSAIASTSGTGATNGRPPVIPVIPSLPLLLLPLTSAARLNKPSPATPRDEPSVNMLVSDLYADTPNPYLSDDNDSLSLSSNNSENPTNYVSGESDDDIDVEIGVDVDDRYKVNDDDRLSWNNEERGSLSAVLSTAVVSMTRPVSSSSYPSSSSSTTTTTTTFSTNSHASSSSPILASSARETTRTTAMSSSSSPSSSPSSPSPALPPGWSQQFSQRANRVYWYNSVTRESLWTFPSS